jgi:pilus assembly protein Flp/PilA
VSEESIHSGEEIMTGFITKMRIAFLALMSEEGQDLVEYALVVALIAFAATAGMNTLAGDINTAFNHIGGKLTIA